MLRSCLLLAKLSHALIEHSLFIGRRKPEIPMHSNPKYASHATLSHMPFQIVQCAQCCVRLEGTARSDDG